tara:strand:- start:163 stop:948 length:786 start_codon:yes stop_codon:yes gene_type:complete
MNAEEFKQDILFELGGGLVNVEFECEEAGVDFDGAGSIDFAFRRAKTVYQQKGNDNWNKVFVPLAVEKGTVEYDLPTPLEDGSGRIMTITKIVKPDYTGFSAETAIDLAAYNNLFDYGGYGGNCGGTRLDYLSYELTLATMERAQRYATYYEQWIHHPQRNKLRFLQDPKISDTWFLEAYVTSSDDEYRDILWIKEYSYALAKKMLGQAYRKFSSLASPTGETSLSGDAMIQEANELERRLMEDIENGVDGMESYSEITFG